MSSLEEYLNRSIPSIIAKSDDLRRTCDLNDTQKKLYGLILEVFSFSANTNIKLNELTEAHTIPILEEIEDHLRQWGKIDKGT